MLDIFISSPKLAGMSACHARGRGQGWTTLPLVSMAEPSLPNHHEDRTHTRRNKEIVEGDTLALQKSCLASLQSPALSPQRILPSLFIIFRSCPVALVLCVFVTRFQQCLGPRTLVGTQHEVTGAQWRWEGWSSTLNDEVPCTHPTLLPPVGQLLQLVMCTV